LIELTLHLARSRAATFRSAKRPSRETGLGLVCTAVCEVAAGLSCFTVTEGVPVGAGHSILFWHDESLSNWDVLGFGEFCGDEAGVAGTDDTLAMASA
jgi:hypothetical protein